MVVQCRQKDVSTVFDYIGSDIGRCLYLYMDLLEFGCESDGVSVWRECGADGGMAAVGLIYGRTCHLFSRTDTVDATAWKTLCQKRDIRLICGASQIVSQMQTVVSGVAEFGWVGHAVRMGNVDEGEDGIRPARREDFRAIAHLLYEHAHYSRKSDCETVQRELVTRWERGFTRHNVLVKNGQIVAHVGTTAECPHFAVVGGAVVDPMCRGQGIGVRLLRLTCAQVQAEGKEAYSFYYDDGTRRFNYAAGLLMYCTWGRMFLNEE